MNLKIIFNKLLTAPAHPSRVWQLLFVSTATLGFVDATYLAIKFFQHEAPACSLLKGCEQVTTGEFASILGIPVALLGTLFYFSLIILFVLYLDSKKSIFLNLAQLFTVGGFLFSLYLIFLQVSVIKALCIYCLFSAATSTILFILGLILKFRFKTSS
jgi:uncharacterized membrane protein